MSEADGWELWERWRAENKTHQQAVLDGDKVDGWPESCAVCGGQWRRTPKGRWIIDHAQHGADHGLGRYHEPPKPKVPGRVGDLLGTAHPVGR